MAKTRFTWLGLVYLYSKVSIEGEAMVVAIVMNVQEATANLSKLLTAVTNGEKVVIANRGVPVAQLVPYKQSKKREISFVKDDGASDDAFFEPLPEEELQLWKL